MPEFVKRPTRYVHHNKSVHRATTLQALMSTEATGQALRCTEAEYGLAQSFRQIYHMPLRWRGLRLHAIRDPQVPGQFHAWVDRLTPTV